MKKVVLLFLLLFLAGCGWKIRQIRPGVIFFEEPYAVTISTVTLDATTYEDMSKSGDPIFDHFEVDIKDPIPLLCTDAPLHVKNFGVWVSTTVSGTGVKEEFLLKVNDRYFIYFIILVVSVVGVLFYVVYYMIKTWRRK